jgi:hypothetical protein
VVVISLSSVDVALESAPVFEVSQFSGWVEVRRTKQYLRGGQRRGWCLRRCACACSRTTDDSHKKSLRRRELEQDKIQAAKFFVRADDLE